MATNKHLQNRVNQLISLGIPQAQATAIAYSEIPTMEIGGNIDSNYLQNLEDESYQLDEEYRLLQSEQDMEWAQGMGTWNDNTMDKQLTKEFREQSKRLDQQDGLNLNTEELKKLFNPYAGYGMEDALMGMGRFIGGDRSVQNAMGFIKAPLAGARSFLSGQGLAKTGDFAREEYDRRQREGLVGNYMQDGGRVTSEDIENITGIRFSEEAANNLFERRVQDSGEAIKRQIELGGYKGRNFFNIQDQESNVRFVPTKENPQNYQGYKRQLKYIQKLNPNIKIDNKAYLEFSQRQPYRMQEGGEVKTHTFEDIMRYARAVEGIEETEEEILFRRFMEYLENNKENLPIINRKAEEITPEEMQRIEEEKMIREHFYQTGGQLTFPERMTGEYVQGIPEDSLEEPVVELEDGEHTLQPDGVMSEVKGKKHSQGGEKLTSDQIEEGTIVVSDHLKIGKDNAKYFKDKYNIKVKASDTYATVVDKIKSKTGLTKLNKEQEKIIKEIQKQEKSTKDVTTKNINLEFLSEKINELEEEKATVEEVVREALIDVYNVQESEKGAEGQPTQDMQVDPNMVGQMAEQYGIPEEQAMGLVQEYLRGGKIPKMQDGSMYQQQVIIDTDGIPRQVIVDVRTGRVVENYRTDPEEPTNTTGEHLAENKLIFGNNISTKEIERYLNSIDENRKRILTNVRDKGRVETNNRNNTNTPEQVNFTWEELQKGKRSPVTGVSNYLTTTGKEPLYREEITADMEGLQELADSLPEVEDKEDKSKVGTGTKRVTRNNQDFFAFPDQSVSPPNSMVAPLKGEVRLGRADAFRIDPSQALVQNQRNFDAQMSQIGNLPPAQRQAAQAALLAEKNNADNQVINSIAAQNAQIESETDRFNLQRSDMEEQLALQNALSYEDRMFRTQAAYDANLDAYYDYMRNLNVARYNDIRNQNMVNSIYENYQINPDGTIGVKPDSERFFELNRMLGQNKNKNNE